MELLEGRDARYPLSFAIRKLIGNALANMAKFHDAPEDYTEKTVEIYAKNIVCTSHFSVAVRHIIKQKDGTCDMIKKYISINPKKVKHEDNFLFLTTGAIYTPQMFIERLNVHEHSQPMFVLAMHIIVKTVFNESDESYTKNLLCGEKILASVLPEEYKAKLSTVEESAESNPPETPEETS